MTEITIQHTRSRHVPGAFHSRFASVESPLPSKPLVDDPCPHCGPTLRDHNHRTTPQRLRVAFGQLSSALIVIAWSVFRLARLVIGMVLCLIGVIGFGIHSLAAQIVHPEDRRLLPWVEGPAERASER